MLAAGMEPTETNLRACRGGDCLKSEAKQDTAALALKLLLYCFLQLVQQPALLQR